jgi:hypothetical protein
MCVCVRCVQVRLEERELLSQARGNSAAAKDRTQSNFDAVLRALHDAETRTLAAAEEEGAEMVREHTDERVEKMEAFNERRDAGAHARALAERKVKCDDFVDKARQEADRWSGKTMRRVHVQARGYTETRAREHSHAHTGR